MSDVAVTDMEELARRLFDQVWPKLEKAVARYGNTHTKEDVWARIASRQAQLWVHPMDDPESAVVTSIETYPTGLIEIHGWLTGGDLEGVKTLEQQIEKWARQAGAHRMLVVGREGFVRALPGYRKVVVMGVKELQNG